jgi:hypothetical protein
LLTIASSDDSTIAARRSAASGGGILIALTLNGLCRSFASDFKVNTSWTGASAVQNRVT